MLTGLGLTDWKKKLVGLGTDGASVNTRSEGGIGVILKKEIPHLIHIHCVAHNLELAVLDACKELPYTTKFQDTVNAILKLICGTAGENRPTGTKFQMEIIDL